MQTFLCLRCHFSIRARLLSDRAIPGFYMRQRACILSIPAGADISQLLAACFCISIFFPKLQAYPPKRVGYGTLLRNIPALRFTPSSISRIPMNYIRLQFEALAAAHPRWHICSHTVASDKGIISYAELDREKEIPVYRTYIVCERTLVFSGKLAIYTIELATCSVSKTGSGFTEPSACGFASTPAEPMSVLALPCIET